MKTLKVYFDESKINCQIITPTEGFYKDIKGKPCNPDWAKLAGALYPGHHSYEVY